MRAATRGLIWTLVLGWTCPGALTIAIRSPLATVSMRTEISAASPPFLPRDLMAQKRIAPPATTTLADTMIHFFFTKTSQERGEIAGLTTTDRHFHCNPSPMVGKNPSPA